MKDKIDEYAEVDLDVGSILQIAPKRFEFNLQD